MKKLAIIGASYLQLPLVEKAREMGLYTLCFAWPQGAVCKDVADEFYPISVKEKDRILAICQKEHIDGVCTIASDVSAPTVAYVAEKMGLVGNSFATAVRANDKSRMRQAFSKAGIPCPRFQVVESIGQLDLRSLSFPLIVKPVDRSGSLGVSRVDHEEMLPSALDIALEMSFKHVAIVEEYIEGREISVEFISSDGRHYPLQITDKVTTGPPHFVELEHHQPADLTEEWKTRINELTKRALNALGITNGASHSEYRITEDGQIYVMEIGARMGGDFIGSDLVRLSTGYDFLKGAIQVALGEFEVPVFGKQGHSGIFFLCKQTSALYDLILDHRVPQTVRAVITDNELHEVKSSADRSGYLIYKDDKRIELCNSRS